MSINTYILQIETATPVCSVAISKNGETMAVVEADGENLHASHLTVFIEEVLAKAGLLWNDIAAVAISMGPGSYTGLRIGVSTAKGLCYALGIPLLSVNTLDSMVHGFVSKMGEMGSKSNIFVPMIDARRMEVYMAQYTAGLACIAETGAHIIDENSFTDTENNSNFILFGSGADKFKTLFEDRKTVDVQVGFRNSASFFGKLAFAKFQQQDFENLVYFEPYYLKDFIATTPRKR